MQKSVYRFAALGVTARRFALFRTRLLNRRQVFIKDYAMEASMDLLIQLWPILIGFVTLVIVLAQMHSKIGVLEEKVRTLFELFNREKDKQ